MSTQQITENGKKVLEYVKAHETPDLEYCPDVLQYWNTVNGRKYFNCKNGKISLSAKEKVLDVDLTTHNNWLMATPTQYFEFLYIKNIPEYDMIEIALGTIDEFNHRGKEGEIKNYRYKKYTQFLGNRNSSVSLNNRIFIVKGDSTIYNELGQNRFANYVDDGKYYSKTGVKLLKEWDRVAHTQFSGKQLRQFTGNYQAARNWDYYHDKDYINLYYFADTYYKYITPRKVSKTKESIQELLKLPLTSTKTIETKYPVQKVIDINDYGNRENVDLKDVFYCEKLNDDNVVIRFLSRSSNYNLISREYTISKTLDNEPFRIYLNKKGKPTIVRKVNDRYEITSVSINSLMPTYYRTACYFRDYDDVFENFAPLKYIKSVLDNSPEKNRVDVLIGSLRHPIIECLTKSGYKNIASVLLTNNTIKANLQNYFGKSDTKGQSLKVALGLNKYQLDKVEELLGSRLYGDGHLVKAADNAYFIQQLLKFTRKLYNTKELSSLSNDITDMIFDGYKKIYGANYASHNVEAYIQDYYQKYYPDEYEVYGYTSWRMTRFAEENPKPLKERDKNNIIKLFKKINSMEQGDYELTHFVGAFIDALRVYGNLKTENKPAIDLYEDLRVDSVVQIHNELLQIQQIQREEERARWDKEAKARAEEKRKAFDKLQEKRREQFEFSTNEDDYIIAIPESPSEIIVEGTSLHHCVGGYADSHSVGDTNIVFLRRKSNPKIPFYTIEVGKYGGIRQIHGINNCWLGLEPNAINFVAKWLKTKCISCAKNILLCTAGGYGSNGIFLNEKDFSELQNNKFVV